jgi:hypothetical protein
MKRMRRRYVLLSFSSQLTSHQEVADLVGEALKSQGIRAWGRGRGAEALIRNSSFSEFGRNVGSGYV